MIFCNILLHMTHFLMYHSHVTISTWKTKPQKWLTASILDFTYLYKLSWLTFLFNQSESEVHAALGAS